MSKLFDDASLAMIPSAYKDGKLYSIRPTDGSGDFTFSRGSNLAATRVDVNGLIEKGRENLLLQSNTFSNAVWAGASTTETSGQSGYDGTNNAWLLEKLVANGNISQSVSASNLLTYSVYAKAGTRDWLRLNIVGVANAYFDLANGVVGSTGGAAAITSAMVDAGGGWYRCSFTYNVASTTGVSIYVADADNDSSGTSGNIYIQDAQLEQSMVATDYIETGASTAQAGILEDMPRLDYSGGATCPSLLLEPQRTNLFTQSEYFDSWVLGGITQPTLTANYSQSPEGLQNAYRVQLPNIATDSLMAQIVSHTSGTDMTISAWVKSASGSNEVFKLYGDYGTPTGRSSQFTATSEWQRFTFTFTPTATGSRGTGLLSINNTASDLLVYAMQIEIGSYPTSYIPTYGSSVTRSAEEYCKVNNIGEFPNEYTLFFEMEDIEASQNNSVVMDLYSTTANTISVRTYETSGEGRLRFVDIVNNSTLFYLEHTSRKYCVRVNGTSVDGFTNGTLVISATAGSSMNNLDDLNIRCGSAQRSSTKYKQLVVFPTALTDSECIALTTL